MDAVEASQTLASLNGFDGCKGLFAGSLESLDLSSRDLGQNELVVTVARLLPRSAATLTVLDLRYVAIVHIVHCYDYNIPLLFGRSNKMGPDGAASIAGALTALTGLQTLRLE